MSDFLDRLGLELEEAAQRRARRRRRGFAGSWSRRSLVLAVLAAVAVIAVPAAAVTGIFSGGSAPESKSPSVVDVGEPCIDKRKPQLDTTTEPPPAELTRLLAVLRRPATPSDRFPNVDGLALLPIAGVNLDAIRMATTLGRMQIFLVPAQNVHHMRPLPDTDSCSRFAQPAPTPAAGVCLLEHGTEGAGGCSDVNAIRKGLSMITGGGRQHSLTRVVGIAPDGVTAVIWRVHRGKGFLDTRIPVRSNVYAANVPGRAGHGLYVYFVHEDGRRTLVRGPHHMTRRERALRRRELARDRAAGPTPSVFPSSGTEKSIFTLRMRVEKPENGVIYVAAWTGPAGTTCATSPNNRIGMAPATSGELRGFMKASFGPPNATRKWCPGRYDGTIRTQRRGRRGADGPVVGRFSFEIR